jgi:hypothetical protein
MLDLGWRMSDFIFRISDLRCRMRHPLSTLHSPLSALSRRGISLLEVLIAIGVLSIGLLSVTALIPIGKLAMRETNKSDRTGACGRAALRDLKVRQLLNFATVWQPGASYQNPLNVLVMPRTPISRVYMCTAPAAVATSGGTEPVWPTTYGDTVSDGGITWRDVGPTNAIQLVAIDPLGVTSGITANLGGATSNILRVNLPRTPTAALAEQIFQWHDDLTFDVPEEPTARPTAIVVGGVPQHDGNFSWFFTAAPSPAEAAYMPMAQWRMFNVSVVVCWKRNLALDAGNPLGEHAFTATCDSADGYGGIGIQIKDTDVSGDNENRLVKEMRDGQWVLLYSTVAPIQYSWYRVVHAGHDDSASALCTRVSLVGPDWHGGNGVGNARVVIIEGVTGVYSTTVQVN